MLKINTTSKYAEFKSDTKFDLYPLNEISYTVENESETVSFYNRFYNKIMTEQISNIQVNDVPVTRDNIQELLSVLFASNEGGGGGETVDLSNYYTKPETNTLVSSKVDKVEGKQLSTEDYTTEEKNKLAGLENYDDSEIRNLIDNTYTKSEVDAKIDEAVAGGEVDLTNYYTKAETDSKVSGKVDKVEGKQLSTEDYTTEEKNKLAGLENYDDSTVKSDIAANAEAIEAEVERATATDATLQSNINKEETRARTAEKELDIKVSTKVDKVDGKQLSTEDYTTEEKTKLVSLENYDDTAVKGDIAANTAAIEAEVTRATNAESELNTKIETKVDKVSGKGLSTNDFTTAEKSKLASLSNYDDSEIRNLIETKADKDKYEKVEGRDYSNFTTFNINGKIKYQYVDMNEANTNTVELYLVLNIENELNETHVLVKGDSTKSIRIGNEGLNVVWKEAPTEIVEGAFYEFIFTYFKSQNKMFAGYIKYE